jgi:hypothetical protein
MPASLLTGPGSFTVLFLSLIMLNSIQFALSSLEYTTCAFVCILFLLGSIRKLYK